MKLSNFGTKFTRDSGILELMEDLGNAAAGKKDLCMLGGGNPAHIDAVTHRIRERMEALLADGRAFERMLVYYDTPKGSSRFCGAVADMLGQTYGWNLTERNVAVVNSSQLAFFYLLNMFSGPFPKGDGKKILFPQCPEYIGYADQALDPRAFCTRRSIIETVDEYTFKYHVDFKHLEVDDSIGGICVSRPTNPTGNVLTDQEIEKLGRIAEEKDIPLFIDGAYGLPFPGIVFQEALPFWNDHTVLSLSLSKLGLPATRTGIIVAGKEIVDAISSINAIISLSSGSIGQTLTLDMIRSGEILSLSSDIIQPFYAAKSRVTREMIEEQFQGIDYAIHKSEGAFFLWIWFKKLPVTTKELYNRLKARNVLVIPGEFFFYGLAEPWEHRDQCIRLNFAQPEEVVRRGIEIIASEVKKMIGNR